MLAAILIFGILTMWVPGRWALSAFQVAICALAIVRLIQFSRRPRGVDVHPIGVQLAAIVLWGVLQAAAGWSVQVLNTQQAALDGVVNLAAFLLAVEETRDARQHHAHQHDARQHHAHQHDAHQHDPHRRDRFLRIFLWFAAVLAVLAIFTALTSRTGYAFWVFPFDQDVLTFGPFVYRNQYAAFVEAILPLAILRAIQDRSRAIGYAAIAVLLFASVVIAGSRTGTFLCLAEILLIPAFAYSKRLIPGVAFFRVVAGSFATIALAVVIAGWQSIWMRLQESNPYAVRANLVRSSLAMFRDRPWTGFGLGAWSVAYPHYALYDDGQFVNQAHNDWVQWAVEGGLPLFAIMLAIAVCILRPAARVIWGLGIVAVFLHCLIDYPFQQRPALAAFFFAWLGVIAAADTPRTTSPAEPDPN